MSIFVNDTIVYSKTYPQKEVKNVSDTNIVQRTAEYFVYNPPKDNINAQYYIDILCNHYTEILFVSKEISFRNEHYGIVSNVKININKTNYKVTFINEKSKDNICIDVVASNYAEAIDKLRFYFRELSDYNDIFGKHVNELERNEYVDYSEER